MTKSDRDSGILESGFPARPRFGPDRSGPKMGFFATLTVCPGRTSSSLRITIANGRQQARSWFVARHGLGGRTMFRVEIVGP